VLLSAALMRLNAQLCNFTPLRDRLPRYIETAAKRGYRLLVPVTRPTGDSVVTSERPATSAASGPATPLQPEAQIGRRSTPHKKYFSWYLLLVALAVIAVAGIIVIRLRGRLPQPVVEKRITTNSPEAPVQWAAISPDGKYLAYAGPSVMYVRQLDTGEVRRLAVPNEFNVPIPASWFPDSTDLVFVEWSEGNEHARSIWRLSILGGSPQKLMDDAYDPAVSPNGSRIAFQRDRDIWIMDSNGANAHRIVNAAEGLDPASWRGYSPPSFGRQPANELPIFKLTWAQPLTAPAVPSGPAVRAATIRNWL